MSDKREDAAAERARVRVAISMLRDDFEELKKLAEEDGETVSGYLRKALATERYIKSRIESGGVRDKHSPSHSLQPFAYYRLRRHIDQDCPEQGEGNAHARQDEVFPRCFQSFMGAIDSDHHHGG